MKSIKNIFGIVMASFLQNSSTRTVHFRVKWFYLYLGESMNER